MKRLQYELQNCNIIQIGISKFDTHKQRKAGMGFTNLNPTPALFLYIPFADYIKHLIS